MYLMDSSPKLLNVDKFEPEIPEFEDIEDFELKLLTFLENGKHVHTQSP
jgi:hypothetical protein